MGMDGLGFVPLWKIIPIIGTFKFPRFRFSCQFPGDGEVNMNVTVDSEETTCKLAKGTAAATDPADLPDRIPAGGILEAQQNYLTDNILAFCQPEFPQEFSFMDTMIGLYP